MASQAAPSTQTNRRSHFCHHELGLSVLDLLSTFPIKKVVLRAGEMAQQLCASRTEDPGLVSSTHMVGYNHVQLQFQGI